MIRLTPILFTALLLTTWTNTSKGQFIKSFSDYNLSFGVDVARPLVGFGFGQAEFGFYGHWHFTKGLGLSVNTGFERISHSRLQQNVFGSSRSTFMALGLDLKIIEQFWVSGYIVRANVFEDYTISLSNPNFFPATRIIYHNFNTLGLAGRMTYFEVLTERIEMQVFVDAGLMRDVNTNINVSQSTPGFLIGAGRAVYMGAGINIGYRLFEKKPN